MIALDDTSHERGWSHQDMMAMPERIFWRYYGPIFRERLRLQKEKEEKETEKAEQEFKDIERKWKERRERGELEY
ncbi:MAG: hypothetical protein QM396_07160 [Euryarchaeota archaeon]|jgi:hypothetical protein|uniref:Uncharacterized protein n=1 Tax=uncultured archaeal virus TaxID=1960247 RepID=A0ABM9HVH1_9VIRU|nr:hypothetical protein [Euryarchaeota archaeon]CAH2570265.1 unnamed protein product [uncultured archaeal virus]CAI3524003.1 unnamed protein product [uncultured archaeal virus]CAI4043384.1 unnamed protein product [uncultured archaeal virus]